MMWQWRRHGAVIVGIITTMASCTHEPFSDTNIPVEPGCTEDGLVCFESSVLPIFVSSCARSSCHDAVTHEEGFILDSYANIIRKGIKPGNADDSEIYEVLFKSGDDLMPPDGPLTQAQKDSIGLWIDQGAKNTTNCDCFCDPELFAYATVIEPIVENACTGCHNPASLGGNINLDGYSNVKIQADNGNLIGAVSHATGFVPMPPGGKLSDCEIQQIQNWIDGGTLNN